ncbi:carboxymuconolactone decarboxylase family protein [Streptomyces rubellomurinus]|uniref:Alkylhydroperoxidase n=2 Tax=Streptomyces TaxID=1883 RepID=A0A0F2TDP0_STRR3|nr:carboxymuconolactone decarboxylase family protein [Streptomyces rubellomurinus]KJS61308.1 alkylhydroperoxidase [Streptomyces rubellomurinus]
MEARLSPYTSPIMSKVFKHLSAASRLLREESTLPVATQELVLLRVSQINGCGFCVDMHFKDAVHEGEEPTRLNLVAAWREATVFTDAERAALELAEHGTRLADGAGVADEVWENAAKHYDEEQLAALVCLISLINAFNRGNVLTRQPAGGYQVGQFR